MAHLTETYRTLGQSAPAATTPTMLYQVSVVGAVLSTFTVCNRGTVASKFRISVRVNGEGDDPKQYIYYDVPISVGDTFAATLGVTLYTADELWVYSETADLTFQVWGSELSL